MQWFFEDDHTPPVFTAEQHANSDHINSDHGGGAVQLPKRAVAFCLGRGLPVLQERFRTRTIMGELPGFIAHSPAYSVEGNDNVCFFDGGRGSPQAGCYVETVHALGVEELLVVGLCGAFGEDINVCDVLIPDRLLIEEGTSHHYSVSPEFAVPDSLWPYEVTAGFLSERGFTVKRRDVVTTDVPYRQTYYKEELWRSRGFCGVDMESSAMVSLCNYYGMKCSVALMASDKHPLSPDSPPWAWGKEDFRERRDDFIEACIRLALR